VIGLLVLGLAVAYVALLVFLAIRVRSRFLKVVLVTVGLLVPFWDLPMGYLHYRRLCQDQGGLQILAKGPTSKSIFVDQGAGYRAEWLAKQGYTEIEYATSSTRLEVATFTVTPNGFEKGRREKPRSALKVSSVYGEDVGWNSVRRDLVLSRMDNGEVIARHSEFHWLGMWWESKLSLAPGQRPSASCHTNGDERLLRIGSGGRS
jgi:hypothetical protein